MISSGLGSLETAANPFIVACGPPRYAEIHINLSQALNAFGTIVGLLLGSNVFFMGTQDAEQALKSVQFVYLGIACFVFLLAEVFFFSSTPEISEANMEARDQGAFFEGIKASFWKRYRLFHAAFAQFRYVGAQVAIAGYFINHVMRTRPGISTAAGSKFLSALMFLVLFFGSICFPTIIAFGTRGLGRHYKRGSGWIIGGVLDGASIPPPLDVVADLHTNTGIAMVVPLAFFAAAVTYPIALNFVASYRIPANATSDSSVGLVENRDEQGSNIEHIEETITFKV